ncbi:MAG: serine hydrolase [Verrucomicrobiales bacterium]|nr:serine hydrolase [Verrucomicrobiales bacterium]
MTQPYWILRTFRAFATVMLFLVLQGAHAAEGIRHDSILFAKPGGVKLFLDLYLPEKVERPPLVMFIHGGGWRNGSRAKCRLSWLVEHGYAVASIEYRLSQEAVFPAQIHDCKGALRWLRANAETYGYDASTVVVSGTSAGGHLAALMGTSGGVAGLEGRTGGNLGQSSLVQGVIDYYGPSDFVMRSGNQPAKTDVPEGSVFQLIGGAVKENLEAARAASPATYIGEGDPPLLIFHGDRDTTVYLDQSELFEERYRSAGLEVDLEVVEGAKHGWKDYPAEKPLVLEFIEGICGKPSREGGKVPEGVQRLRKNLEDLEEESGLVGLQVAIRDASGLLYSAAYGTASARGGEKVNEETLFLVASCSKPFASACVLALVADQEVPIQLDSPISRWLPGFESARLKAGGVAARSPTVAELLSHRAGIYSQKSKLTAAELRWIRDHTLTLEESVEGIVSVPLSADPGSEFAYSGAGYCVLGRAVELVGERSFEEIFQERVCAPLGLKRTTYFPARHFPIEEIATGLPLKASPHLFGHEHRLALVGGSLYSTAEEMTRFGLAVAEGWNESGSGFPGIPSEMIVEAGTSKSERSQYGLGWKVVKRNGKTIRLSHSGSLGSHRAWLAVDLEAGLSVAGCWTLSGAGEEAPVTGALQNWLNLRQRPD